MNDIGEILMPLFILGIPITGTFLILQAYLNFKLKKQMIEKGFVDEAQQAIFTKQSDTGTLGSLKWGLIIFFGGLGLVVLEFIEYSYDSPFPFGIVAVFTAMGFLVYYVLAKKELEKNSE